jgi:hypothetical protein
VANVGAKIASSSASSRAIWLMAGGPAVITDHEAGNVHRFEVPKGETCKAREIGIVPTSVGRADESPTVSVVGQDNAIVSECGDDNGGLWAGGGTSGSRHRSL